MDTTCLHCNSSAVGLHACFSHVSVSVSSSPSVHRAGGLFLPPLSPYVQHKPSGWEYIRQAGDARKLHPVIEAGGALWGENFQNYLSGTRDPGEYWGCNRVVGYP